MIKISKVINFIGILLISSINVWATDYEIDIERKKGGTAVATFTSANDVNDFRGVVNNYRAQKNVGTINGVTTWNTFLGNLENSKETGIVGEKAAIKFFAAKGYQIVQAYYNQRIQKFIDDENNRPDMMEGNNPAGKKGPDNGIDSIFVPQGSTLANANTIIINEAKYRGGNRVKLYLKDFGTALDPSTRQSHSRWNSHYFNQINDIRNGRNYSNYRIIRTATLLNNKGELRLFEIKDQVGIQGYSIKHRKFAAQLTNDEDPGNVVRNVMLMLQN